MDYQDYLKSAHWQRLRRIALEKAKHRCQLCNVNNVQLDVHHRTYERLGCEYIEDLTVLCCTCHERHHKFDEFVASAAQCAVNIYEMLEESEYYGNGLCRRCGQKATQNFGTDDQPALVCDISCELKFVHECYDSESIPESPRRMCENCFSLARSKFKISDWTCLEAYEEHFACGDDCRDSIVLQLDSWHLRSESTLDAGQFSGTTLSALPDWYLQCVEESVPANGSKIRRACTFEKWRRNQDS
jgi:hypothetical protein